MRLQMTRTWLRGAIFPITVFAFCAVGVSYANVIFTSSARWLFLAVLAFAVVRAGRVFTIMNTRFGPLVLIYCVWALLTSLWSIVPDLSLAKGIASISTTLVFVAAGRYWSGGWTSVRPIFFLTPVALAALASSLGGVTDNAGGGLQLYKGITGNPNLLGFLVAASFPPVVFVAYRAFTQRSAPFMRFLSVLAIFVLFVLLWRSASRSGIVCSLCILGFAALALRASKLILMSILAANVAAIVMFAVPEFNELFYERLVLKSSNQGDIFFSRRGPWRESVEGAKQGGWIGLGYGASYGDSEFEVGLTAYGYGREKGNSQLAIIEEMGIVGGILYGLLILVLLWELIGALRRAPNQDVRMELALLTGLVFGLLVQSVVEGWWTAPGSAESAVFWSTVGVASGLARRAALVHAEMRKRSQAPPSYSGQIPQGASIRHPFRVQGPGR